MSQSNTPYLTISIIVHGDFSHIRAALESIPRATAYPPRVIIVVNLATPEQTRALREAFPQYEFIVNAHPQGFAANHNRVMALALTPYVALLNDDIVLHEGALDMLTEYLDTHPTVGVVAPKLVNIDGSYQVSMYADPTLLRMMYKISGLARLTRQGGIVRTVLIRSGLMRLPSLRVPREAESVDIVKGAAMVVRLSAYRQVGGMDEVSKAYGEEADWHLRFRQAGWQVAIVPQAVVTHVDSGQSQLKMQGWQLVEDRRAILNYFIKHKPAWQARMIRLTIVIVHGLMGVLWAIMRSPRAEGHLQAARMGLRWRRTT